MPELDEDTIALPEGRFFNKRSGKYVVSGVIGAAEVTVEEPPKRRAPKKPAAKPAEAGTGGEATSADAAPPAEMKALGQHEEQVNNSSDTTANGAEDPADAAEVQQAPRGLSELLAAALPSRKQ